MKILPVILSGGSGTRLWPASRADYPKQLQKLHGELTLLQQTALRLPVGAEIAPPVVICNAQQRFMVAEQLQEIGVQPSLIVLEPVGRSTAAAVAVPALWVENPADTVIVAMPADHYIADAPAFADAVKRAAAYAMQGNLMTLGVAPTRPHTGFGYIERGEPLPGTGDAYAARQFKEKPDAATAETYLRAGTFYWNAGIFALRADRYLDELEALQPAVLAACREALRLSQRDLDFLRLDEASFAASPDISIDYAVMEKADKVGVLPVSFPWSDIGGWLALWQIADRDERQNATFGDVMLKDSDNCYVRGGTRLIAAVGLHDIAIVDTPDALFVARMDRADEVKDIVAALKKAGRKEAKEHSRVYRPWGHYETIDQGARYQVKQIVVKPNGKLSLQKHHHRAEHWVVVSGTARVTIGDEVRLLAPNESVYIPLGVKHRLENPGLMPLFLIEVQSGDYLGEDDIVRFEDVYKRD